MITKMTRIASVLVMPSAVIKIFTIARMTQPTIMQFMRMPKYMARKPRKKAAGLPA